MQKIGHASSLRPSQEIHAVVDSIVMAACSGNMTFMEIGAEKVMKLRYHQRDAINIRSCSTLSHDKPFQSSTCYGLSGSLS